MASSWYTLRRRDVELNGELSPGEYCARRSREGDKVTWRCPTCEKLIALTKDVHDVRYDGTIYPSVSCPHRGCKFSEWIHLDGWIPKAKGAA